jgi:hypothetical protein
MLVLKRQTGDSAYVKKTLRRTGVTLRAIKMSDFVLDV